MKNLLWLLPFCITSPVAGQIMDKNFATNGFVELYDAQGKPLTRNKGVEAEGTPLLNTVWANGEVHLKNGQRFRNVPLQFNLMEGELYFNKEGNLFQFAEPVLQFSFTYTEVGQTQNVLFRSGYPAADKKGVHTLYQVVTEGDKVQLLKHISKKVIDVYEYSSPGKKKFFTTEELFLYDVGTKKMISIKKTKGAPGTWLPAYSARLTQLLENKKASTLTQKDWEVIVAALNQ